jgi:hypothetical protein
MELYEMYLQTIDYIGENYSFMIGGFLGGVIGTILPERYNPAIKLRKRLMQKRAERNSLENKLDDSSLD